MEYKFTDENFKSEVLEADGLVLVDFYADWCGPCKMMAPVIAQIADEVSDVKVGKLNVDDSPNTAGQFNIMSIPTLLYVKGGQVVNQSVGAQPKAAILEAIEKFK
ncbi:MAG: thioredoxin [Lachnospiraceae bacterium]|nr:thioredoxin [Lachnospiraceae bacterium]